MLLVYYKLLMKIFGCLVQRIVSAPMCRWTIRVDGLTSIVSLEYAAPRQSLVAQKIPVGRARQYATRRVEQEHRCKSSNDERHREREERKDSTQGGASRTKGRMTFGRAQTALYKCSQSILPVW